MIMKKTFLFITVVLFLFSSCGIKKQSQQHASDDEYYTCSMHPQIMQPGPGTCPICHMELILVKKTNTTADEILLNDEQVRLGNIRVDTIRNGAIDDNLVLTATLSADETKANSINARISGRIDRLYFKNEGDFVPKGALLYELYSEELNNAKQEFLAALERREKLDNSIIDFNRLVQSAKTKLLLWGMTEAQIADLEKNKIAPKLTSFYSPVSGYVTELPLMEGQYVMEGGMVMRLADLSSLWAEAQVYESQIDRIDRSAVARVQFPDLPGKEFSGKISFENPEIATGTRVSLVRITVPNNGGQLKPGMPAYVIIRNRSQRSLTLPLDAVLRDGKMNMVWVQAEKNIFKMKMVETGIESGDRIEIKSGLENGDVVVTSGAYLLNSEYIFKKGADEMTHDMGNMKM
ncbi:MAG: efflux RND transporter periplasmic adaptor subunit [Chitinophagaceae bacterium]|nr:efflux RND transporter periplasmic adaptor subunit [Chitinophagaceae bacterium]